MFKRKPSVTAAPRASAAGNLSKKEAVATLSLDLDPNDFIRSLQSGIDSDGKDDMHATDEEADGAGNIGSSGPKKRPPPAAQGSGIGTKVSVAKKQKLAAGRPTEATRPKASSNSSNSCSAAKPPPLPMYNSFFEFHEAGAYKIVIDTIQYELDGLFFNSSSTASNTISLRRHCASKLFEIISESIDNKHIVLASGVSRTLIRVTGLLSSENDAHIRACLQAILLYLCRDDRGAIDCASIANLPVNVFEGVVAATFDAMKSDRVGGAGGVATKACNGSASKTAPDGSAVRKRSFAVQRPAQAQSSPSSPAATAAVAGVAAAPAAVLAHSAVYLSLLLGSPSGYSSEDLCMGLGTAFLNRSLAAAVNDAGGSGAEGTDNNNSNTIKEEETSSRSRQALLALYQRSLRTPRNQLFSSSEDPPSSSGSGSLSLLHILCNGLFEGVIRIAGSVSSSGAAASSASFRLRMWHALGIIECASCNCPEGQEHLASLTCSACGEEAPLAVVVLQLFRLLSAAVLRDMASTEDTHNDNDNANKDKDLDDYEEGDVLSHLCSGRDSEKDQIRCLYPELCSRDLAVAAGNKLFDSTGSRTVCSRQRLSLTLKELWLSSLRVLVNLTHRCPRACDHLRAAGFLPFATAVLASVFQTRARRTPPSYPATAGSGSGTASSSGSSSSDGPLSPTETKLEKAVFDASLFVTSTLTNIYESSTLQLPLREGSDECHAFSSSQLSHILTQDSVASITEILCTDAVGNIASLDEVIRALQELVQQQTRQLQACGVDAGIFGEGSASISVDFTSFLTAFLSVEAADFLDDIVFTDDAFSGAAAAGGKKASPPSSQSSGSGPTPPRAAAAGEQLPVAELILSSHIVLLLYAIARRGAEAADSNALVVELLPRRSWWLPMRVLKAFLALQGQAGVLVVASVAPVVAALTAMREWGEKRLERSGGGSGAEDGEPFLDWLASDEKAGSRVKSSTAQAPAASAATGKWVRDGDDYRWVEADASTSIQSSSQGSAQSAAISSLSSGNGGNADEPTPNPHRGGARVVQRTFLRRRNEVTAIVDVDALVLY